MAAAVVNEEKYIQHNPQTHEGSPGIAALFARLAKTSPTVKIVRVFEDGDFAFAHVEYDFSSVKAGFEVFRFEDGRAVEHWDNLQALAGPSPSGHGMLDGSVAIVDLDETEANRAFARSFVNEVLISRQLNKLADYVDRDLVQHDPEIADGVRAFQATLEERFGDGHLVRYDRLHRVLAEGNFALSVSEGRKRGAHSSFYDLFRIEDGLIVEHWNTIETVPPRSEWKNSNGKF